MNISETTKEKFYQAFITKNSEFEGIFFVGVKSTKIFCRPTCGAKKAKLNNIEFFLTSNEALEANYKPCKRCKPLEHPQQISNQLQQLLNDIDSEPDKKWHEADLKEYKLNPSTTKRYFKKRFNLTFIQYVRARKMEIGINRLELGGSVIDAQLETGYESSSGFREAFTKILGATPSNFKDNYNILKCSWIDTPLGTMLAIADDEKLYTLDFIQRKHLQKNIEKLKLHTKSVVLPGTNEILEQIKDEIDNYFLGNLKNFKTPVAIFGTEFQKKTWEALKKIPYGTTISYATLAKNLALPKAFRAVANANGCNKFAILIPCHRVINENGRLGGYAGGIEKKKWLLEHEMKFK